jgi:hypothetical protein
VIPSLVAVTATLAGWTSTFAGAPLVEPPLSPAPPDAAQPSDGNAAHARSANTAISFARWLTIDLLSLHLAYGVS